MARVELGAQPFLGCAKHDGLLRKHLEFGARLALIEHDDHVAGLDLVALPHSQFLDDAAVEMLHALAVSVDLDDAGRDHRAVERGRDGPCPENAEKQHNDEPARHRNTADRVARSLGL